MPAPATLASAGLPEIAYADARDIGRFGTAQTHERLLIFGALSGPPQIPMLNEARSWRSRGRENAQYRIDPIRLRHDTAQATAEAGAA